MSHAVVMSHDHPQRDTFPQQLQFLKDRIIPMVRGLPGFQSGHWCYEAGPSRTHSFLVFETAAQAQGLVDLVKTEAQQPNPFGITMLAASVTEVTAAVP